MRSSYGAQPVGVIGRPVGAAVMVDSTTERNVSLTGTTAEFQRGAELIRRASDGSSELFDEATWRRRRCRGDSKRAFECQNRWVPAERRSSDTPGTEPRRQ